MPKRKSAADKPKREPTRPTAAEIEALLDKMEQALLNGDGERMDAATEQLWPLKRQIPAILLDRIACGRSRAPGFAFELFDAFAGARANTYLKRIAEDSSVTDQIRFGARRRMGWPERGEKKRRLAFLQTLHDVDGTLVGATKEAVSVWPPEGEILEEVLGYLTALPTGQRNTVLKAVASEFGDRATWLLHALLHVDDSETQRLAIDELVALRDRGAVGPLERLAKTGKNAQVRSEADAAAKRLQMRLVDQSKPMEAQPLPPLDRAMLSAIDESGGQMILVVRAWDQGPSLYANIFFSDQWGLKGVFGDRQISDEQVEDMLAEFEEELIEFVEVGLAGLRGALSAAVEVNAATGHPIPPGFEIWEPLLHHSYPPPPGEPITTVELDDSPYANRNDLIRSSEALADHPFFRLWAFDPIVTLAAMVTTPPPKGLKLTDQHYRPIIRELLTPDRRELLRWRLRRQAWLLEVSGSPQGRDLALAVAAQLRSGKLDDLIKQPFLRALVRQSVLRVLAFSPGIE